MGSRASKDDEKPRVVLGRPECGAHACEQCHKYCERALVMEDVLGKLWTISHHGLQLQAPMPDPQPPPNKILIRGVSVRVKGVTGRDAIDHKRRRNISQNATQ